MPITELFTYEENNSFFVSDKYGLSSLPFSSELSRTIFIENIPPPKPKISKRKPNPYEELDKPRKSKQTITTIETTEETTEEGD
jgi:hypothetical protein